MKNNYSVIALLPMKAHSERIPGKNFKLINGKPLFKYILDTLLSIEEISKIIINTDAKNVLMENGLKETERVFLRQRKEELCGDFVSMNLILKDDIENIPADFYLMTHVTNPLLNANTIKKAIKDFIERDKDKYDSMFSVNRYQSRFYRKDGSPVNHDPKVLIRTQDLDPLYEENSNLYIFTRESFEKTNARIGSSPMMFETPFLESVDIDDYQNWELADKLLKK